MTPLLFIIIRYQKPDDGSGTYATVGMGCGARIAWQLAGLLRFNPTVGNQFGINDDQAPQRHPFKGFHPLV